MIDFHSKIKIKPLINNKFELLESWQCENVKVPKGFITDGATIPRAFWWFVPPFKPKFLPAIIIHDYLCDREKYKLADALFERTLFAIEKSLITKTMVKSVKIYHKIKYGV